MLYECANFSYLLFIELFVVFGFRLELLMVLSVFFCSWCLLLNGIEMQVETCGD